MHAATCAKAWLKGVWSKAGPYSTVRTYLDALSHGAHCAGGHAAHFANIDQGSPFFSQERAPTSVAYAENQSMFLDSLMGDGDWLARYARDLCVQGVCLVGHMSVMGVTFSS